MEIRHHDDLLDRKEDLGEMLVSSGNMNLEYYHLRPETMLNIWFNANDLLRGAETHYLLLEGALEIRLPAKRVEIRKGDTFSMYSQTPFTMFALEESVLVCCNNTDTSEIDACYTDLVNYVIKAEENDYYVQGHNNRVSRYTGMLMHIVDPHYQGTDHIVAAMCHDIGKVKISREILNKPGRLTEEEFREIQKHPVYSYELLREKTTEHIALLARWHHEKPDGSGYPDGLKGDQIPLGSRVMAVADVFDAMTTSRSYRKAFSFRETLDIMRRDVGKNHLDADAFRALEQLIEAGTIVEGVDDMYKDDPTW